jgi:hypothetical protein
VPSSAIALDLSSRSGSTEIGEVLLGFASTHDGFGDTTSGNAKATLSAFQIPVFLSLLYL